MIVVLFIAADKAAEEDNILSGQLLCVADPKIGVACVSFTPKDEIGCSFRNDALVAVPDAERDFAKKEFNALLTAAFE